MERILIKYTVLLLLAVMSMNISAQNSPGEFSIHAGGGLSHIRYQLAPDVHSLNGFAVNFGIGYTYFFHRNWGIYAGANQSFYKAQRYIDRQKVFTPALIDANGYGFDLHTTFDYREIHQIAYLHIPVMLRFQQKQAREHWSQKYKRNQGFYAMGGIKVSIPFANKYEYVSDMIAPSNVAYYPEFDNWAATQKFAGLGVFDDKSFGGKFELDTSFILALEGGRKWRLNDKLLLYAGAYFDFGLNNAANANRTPLRNHIAVEHLTDFKLLEFSNRMNLISAGVILRLAFFREPQRGVCRNIGKNKF